MGAGHGCEGPIFVANGLAMDAAATEKPRLDIPCSSIKTASD
jgi:hypothetical protein